MDGLQLPDTPSRHLAYHARMAASFAVAGSIDECASEAVLVWAILEQYGGVEAADSLSDDLPDNRVARPAPNADPTARSRACALALDLEGHFASEGQTEAATFYEELAAALRRL